MIQLIKTNKLYIILALLYISWALTFIYKSSFLVFGGERYFSLFDDAMISLNYAYNLSHGEGLTWNMNERVEGYTNPLWVLVMSGFTLVLDKKLAVLGIQLLGIGFVLGIGMIATRFTTINVFFSKKQSALAKTLLLMMIFSYYPLNYWSLMGMETAFLTLIVTYMVFVVYKHFESPTAGFRSLATLFLTAYLIRPDSLYISGTIIVWLLLRDPSAATARKAVTHLVLPMFIVLVLHTIFRFYYYGDVIPNTVRLKVIGLPIDVRLRSGWGFTSLFLKESALYLVLIFLSLFQRYFSKQKLLIVALFVCTVVYQIYVGGDPWDYWRMFTVVMPLLMIYVLSFILIALERFSSRKAAYTYFTTAFTLLLILTANSKFAPEMLFRTVPFQASYNKENTEYALLLNELTLPGAKIGLLWAGTIPYYSDRYFIDFLGKLDKHIADSIPHPSSPTWLGMESVPGHNKYDLHYSILELKPDIVQSANWDGDNLWYEQGFPYSRVSYKGKEFIVRNNSDKVTIN